jgi:hypothetical protein
MTTSKRDASLAARLLGKRSATSVEKSVAASDLTQRKADGKGKHRK